MVLSEVVERLMMMSGSDASTCPAECGQAATSRLTEVVATTVPAGHRRLGRTEPGTLKPRSGDLWLAPLERRAVHPDAMEDHGDFSSDGNFRFLHSNPLCEFHAPGLEG